MYFYYPYYGYKKECEDKPVTFPPQHQDVQPGLEYLMCPRPIFDNPNYKGSGKLKDKIALITGGDSGIGRAVTLAFAKEGADVAIAYLYEHEDAVETQRLVEAQGRKCLLLPGDLREESFCKRIVEDTINNFGKLDILVNNAGVVFPQYSLEDITSEQLENTFCTNIFSFFHVTKAALPYMKRGSAIVNTASIAAYTDNEILIDYSSSKGAVVSFTRSLALSLLPRGIRVNGVAPGPIWTPLIVSGFSAQDVSEYGLQVPMKRAGQPVELTPAYVYLASDDSSYMTGQILHVDGAGIIS